MVTIVTGFCTFVIWVFIASQAGPCIRAIQKPHDWIDRSIGGVGIFALVFGGVMGVTLVNKVSQEPQNIMREP